MISSVYYFFKNQDISDEYIQQDPYRRKLKRRVIILVFVQGISMLILSSLFFLLKNTSRGSAPYDSVDFFLLLMIVNSIVSLFGACYSTKNKFRASMLIILLSGLMVPFLITLLLGLRYGQFGAGAILMSPFNLFAIPGLFAYLTANKLVNYETITNFTSKSEYIGVSCITYSFFILAILGFLSLVYGIGNFLVTTSPYESTSRTIGGYLLSWILSTIISICSLFVLLVFMTDFFKDIKKRRIEITICTILAGFSFLSIPMGLFMAGAYAKSYYLAFYLGGFILFTPVFALLGIILFFYENTTPIGYDEIYCQDPKVARLKRQIYPTMLLLLVMCLLFLSARMLQPKLLGGIFVIIGWLSLSVILFFVAIRLFRNNKEEYLKYQIPKIYFFKRRPPKPRNSLLRYKGTLYTSIVLFVCIFFIITSIVGATMFSTTPKIDRDSTKSEKIGDTSYSLNVVIVNEGGMECNIDVVISARNGTATTFTTNKKVHLESFGAYKEKFTITNATKVDTEVYQNGVLKDKMTIDLVGCQDIILVPMFVSAALIFTFGTRFRSLKKFAMSLALGKRKTP